MPIVRGFRRFHSNIVLSGQVATEVSNLASQSNVEQSGRSSADPVTSDRPVKKRVNIADRRELLQSFVNKYRALNMGKFPSPTSAKKEVGGGYYSIKKMLQEMEYVENKKHIKGDDALIPETAMKSSRSQKKSHDQITVDQNICRDPGQEFRSNFDKKTDTRNTSIASDDTLNIATENDEKLKQDPKDDNVAYEDSGSSVEKQSVGIGNITRDKGEKDSKLREEASLWGNLKSLANGFMNMWKK